MEISKKEAIQHLEDGMDIIVQVEDDRFTIGDMQNYLNAPEDEEGFISEYLGNVYYSDASEIVEDTIEGMSDGEEEAMRGARFFLD